MSDEETKALLRQITATQKDLLTHVEGIAHEQRRLSEARAADSGAYQEMLKRWDTSHRKPHWIAVLHTMTMAAVVGLLMYVVVYVMHHHL